MKIEHFETIESTNTYLKELVRRGDHPEDRVVISDSQTGGRGRTGKTFFSPEGGLYLSVLIKPECSVEDTVKITCAAGVVAAEILHGKIKWVNDIIIDGKKVCGILCEKAGNYIIIGVGINLKEPEGGFPEEIQTIAGTVEGDKDKLAKKLIGELAKLSDPKQINRLMKKYKKLSCILRHFVTVKSAEKEYKALVLDINSEGHLIVEKEDGERVCLTSGEVSLKNWK